MSTSTIHSLQHAGYKNLGNIICSGSEMANCDFPLDSQNELCKKVIKMPVNLILATASDIPSYHRKKFHYESSVTPKNINYFLSAADHPVILIDCSFECYHNRTAIISMSQQLIYCYSAINKSRCPILLYLCGIGAKTFYQLTKNAIVNHKVYITSRPLESVIYGTNMPKHDPLVGKTLTFVYLSADSDNVVDLQPHPSWKYSEGYLRSNEMEKPHPHDSHPVLPTSSVLQATNRMVYIVGGIVDRNSRKGLCVEKAKELGITHARLPICGVLAKLGCKVLTTNHIVDLLVRVYGGLSWYDAINAVVPKRKVSDGTSVPVLEQH